ncbi:MAG: amidohydrolase family protein, partial [Candidatus Ornithospirochaeta sp.]
MEHKEIIDAHAHIFSPLSGFGADGELKPLEGGKAVWSTGEVIQLLPKEYEKTEFTSSDLIALMDKASIKKAVLLQGGFLGFDNYGVVEAAKKYPDRLVPALTLDPFSRNVDKILSHLLTLGADAFKFEVSTGCGLMGIHRSFPLDGEMMYGIYRKLYGKISTIAFDIGSPGDESHQIDALAHIARDFPSFNIVVCHLSSPRRGQEENLRQELDLLSIPNIYFDTAALFWKTRPEEYPFEV